MLRSFRSCAYAQDGLLELTRSTVYFSGSSIMRNRTEKAGWREPAGSLHIARELLEDLKNSLMNVTV